MTERLQSALADIADRAPVAQVPDDTYRRGRRSHRTRLAAGVTALVLVLLGLSSVVRTTPDDVQPASGSGGGAVPSRLYGVPQRLTMTDPEGRWTGPVESDLAIGTGSASWVSTVGGPPVVVTAADGAYHLLHLPGYLGNGLGMAGLGPAVALSPDGRSLAYAWSAAGELADVTEPSGVRVVDLVSGELRTIPVPSDAVGTLVQQIVWSPDSRWLAWAGGMAQSANTLHGSVRGLIAPDTTTSTALPTPRDAATAMGVDDAGRVALLSTNRTLLVQPSGRITRRPVALPRPTYVGEDHNAVAFSPGSDRLAMPTYSAGGGAAVLDVATEDVLARAFPGRPFPGRVTVRPLGWVDDQHLLAEVSPASGPQSLVVIATSADDDSVRTVVRSDTRLPESLSVAVDLMAPDRYTADLPAPDWPWSTERKIVVGLVVAAALGLVLWAALTLLRRRWVFLGN